MDGGALAEQFKADPDLKKVPLVFLTAIVTRQETGVNGANIGGAPSIPIYIPVKSNGRG